MEKLHSLILRNFWSIALILVSSPSYSREKCPDTNQDFEKLSTSEMIELAKQRGVEWAKYLESDYPEEEDIWLIPYNPSQSYNPKATIKNLLFSKKILTTTPRFKCSNYVPTAYKENIYPLYYRCKDTSTGNTFEYEYNSPILIDNKGNTFEYYASGAFADGSHITDRYVQCNSPVPNSFYVKLEELSIKDQYGQRVKLPYLKLTATTRYDIRIIKSVPFAMPAF